MSVLDPKKTYRNLKKKGFIDSPDKSDDHKYLELHLICFIQKLATATRTSMTFYKTNE